MKIAALLLVLILAGCVDVDYLSPQQMRVDIKKCQDHGLRAVLVTNGWGDERIACRPHAEK